MKQEVKVISARHLGYAILFDVKNVCSVWFCNFCEAIFHTADLPLKEIKMKCPSCKKDLTLTRFS
jgi:hypothetical protein